MDKKKLTNIKEFLTKEYLAYKENDMNPLNLRGIAQFFCIPINEEKLSDYLIYQVDTDNINSIIYDISKDIRFYAELSEDAPLIDYYGRRKRFINIDIISLNVKALVTYDADGKKLLASEVHYYNDGYEIFIRHEMPNFIKKANCTENLDIVFSRLEEDSKKTLMFDNYKMYFNKDSYSARTIVDGLDNSFISRELNNVVVGKKKKDFIGLCFERRIDYYKMFTYDVLDSIDESILFNRLNSSILIFVDKKKKNKIEVIKSEDIEIYFNDLLINKVKPIIKGKISLEEIKIIKDYLSSINLDEQFSSQITYLLSEFYTSIQNNSHEEVMDRLEVKKMCEYIFLNKEEYFNKVLSIIDNKETLNGNDKRLFYK